MCIDSSPFDLVGVLKKLLNGSITEAFVLQTQKQERGKIYFRCRLKRFKTVPFYIFQTYFTL